MSSRDVACIDAIERLTLWGYVEYEKMSQISDTVEFSQQELAFIEREEAMVAAGRKFGPWPCGCIAAFVSGGRNGKVDLGQVDSWRDLFEKVAATELVPDGQRFSLKGMVMGKTIEVMFERAG
jgi:hypothetical protein